MKEEKEELEEIQDKGLEDQESVEEKPTSSRDYFLGRMKERRPDVDFEDEESRYGAYLDYDDEVNERLGRLEESNSKISETFSKDPRFAEMMLDIYNGEDLVVAFAKHFGDVMEMDMEDEEVASRVAEANRERIQRIAEEEERAKVDEEERQKGIERVGQVIADFTKSNNLSDEEVGKILDKFSALAEAGIKGDISEEDLQFIRRGLSYDLDVDGAITKGRLEGRNERIDLDKSRRVGDGIPHLSAISSQEVKEDKQPMLRRPSMYDQK